MPNLSTPARQQTIQPGYSPKPNRRVKRVFTSDSPSPSPSQSPETPSAKAARVVK